VWLEGLGASLAINAYRTLKSLALRIVGYDHDPLCGLSRELIVIAGNNILEELELDVVVQPNVTDEIESLDLRFYDFDSMLTESGSFPMLHRVSVEIRWHSLGTDVDNIDCILEYLKEQMFPRLEESEAVEFNFFAEM
jgi:hypothetical protein